MENNNKKISKIMSIRQMICSLIALSICSWAFWQNEKLGKIMLMPFIISALTLFFKELFILTDKPKIAKVFKMIYFYSFLLYIVGIWGYFLIYSLFNSIQMLIILIIFTIMAFPIIKKYYKNLKNKN